MRFTFLLATSSPDRRIGAICGVGGQKKGRAVLYALSRPFFVLASLHLTPLRRSGLFLTGKGTGLLDGIASLASGGEVAGASLHMEAGGSLSGFWLKVMHWSRVFGAE